MRETNTTKRSNDKYGVECGVTTYPDDDDAPPKVGIWASDDNGKRDLRVLGFDLTADNVKQLRGADRDGISCSWTVFELFTNTVRASDAEMPEYE